jgi:hypothetical protein
VQQVLDPTPELLVLARQMDWEAITLALRPYYHKLGRYTKPIRLMVGLHLLKHRENLSDAQVVQGLHENLYWMALASPARVRHGIPTPTRPGSSGCNDSVPISNRCSVISKPTIGWTVVDIVALRAISLMSAGRCWPGTPRSGSGCSTSAS